MTIEPIEKVEATDKVFSAISHPSRRHILLTLQFRGGHMSAGDIANRFGCSWPTTTRHLNILKDAELISVKKEGRERIYTLNSENLLKVTSEWFNWFRE